MADQINSSDWLSDSAFESSISPIAFAPFSLKKRCAIDPNTLILPYLIPSEFTEVANTVKSPPRSDRMRMESIEIRRNAYNITICKKMPP
jgi:hypothetical protein